MKLFKKIHSFFAKEKNREQVIILDASALKTHKAMQIIKEASKVVLLYGTIKELDKEQEKSTELYKKNKCYILRESREDVEGKKYLCVSGYEKYSYVDDNIIEYCKDHQGTTILSCDNGLCNKAKALNIPYIFPEDKQKQQPNSNSEKEEQREEKAEQREEKEEYEKDLEEVFLSSRGIYITPIKGCYVNYAVVRENKIIDSNSYKQGDDIYVFRYHNKHNWMELIVYNIVNKNKELKAKKFKEYEICCLNDIYRLHLSEELEEQIRNFYMKN